jgi:hypothetical protein
MPWQQVGSLIPDIPAWAPFGPQVSGGELFRVTQAWDGLYPGPGYALIRQRWEPEGVWDYERIYPNETPHLYRLGIPGELRAADRLARFIECKLSSRAVIPVNSNWTLTLEVWDGPLPTVPTAPATADPYSTDPGSYLVLDGGTYP